MDPPLTSLYYLLLTNCHINNCEICCENVICVELLINIIKAVKTHTSLVTKKKTPHTKNHSRVLNSQPHRKFTVEETFTIETYKTFVR